MQRIFSGPHACAVAHVHSPAPLTRDALVQDLTFSTPHDLAPLHDEKNVIEMARAAGYKTYWISSTSERGFYSSEIGQISGYSDDFSDQFTNNPRPGGGTGDDLDLIARFKAVLNPAERQIIFLHLNGSHLPYGVRYDIDDARALPGPPSDQLDYDRSLHHTDRLVSGVYDLLHAASSDYLLFYAPDHGEVIDPAAVAKAGATGHGLEFGGVDQYEIPLMMTSTRDGYCSDVERYRGADGMINAFAEHDLFSQFVGYRIGPAAWRAYEAEQPYVLHSDEHVYRYPDLPTR
jgi:heptose-I-phosphate ethanolaminephosphotransferase